MSSSHSRQQPDRRERRPWTDQTEDSSRSSRWPQGPPPLHHHVVVPTLDNRNCRPRAHSKRRLATDQSQTPFRWPRRAAVDRRRPVIRHVQGRQKGVLPEHRRQPRQAVVNRKRAWQLHRRANLCIESDAVGCVIRRSSLKKHR